MSPTPTLGNVYRLVSEDEKHRAIVADKVTPTESVAFKAFIPAKRENKHGSKRDKQPAPKEEKRSSLADKRMDTIEHCTHCGRNGHNRDGCFKLIGYPEWWPGNKRRDDTKPKAACVDSSEGPVPGLTENQYNTFLKFFAENGKNTNEDTKRMAYMAGKTKESDEWIIDSGSTEHITHKIELFDNNVKTLNEKPVVIPNGQSILVKGKGDCLLSGGTKIKGVLHIPDFTCNLLSVSRLSRDLQAAITFFLIFVLCRLFNRGT
jgi:hypothetical protein